MAVEMDRQRPPLPQRPPATCRLHPGRHVTGFCASCLRERLSNLETPTADSGGVPELRRCQSFSGISPFPRAFEPQRRSCDARTRNTLGSLFHQDDHYGIFVNPAPIADPVPEAREDDDEETETRTMKDHIDREAQFPKKPPLPKTPAREIPGSFWLAAAFFNRKLQTWRRNHNLKKKQSKTPFTSSSSFQQEGKTQSEVAADAFGRRSCDIPPRFSLDAARISFDNPRCSWDGQRSVVPPMLSVMEDNVVPEVERIDCRIPVEDEDSVIPGGSAQTRDYYLDSSTRHRRSLDRSSSTRKPIFEIDQPRPISNAKVSPTGGVLFQVGNGIKHEPDWRESRSKSSRDDPSKSFNQTLPPKKSKRWSKPWKILGLIHRRSTHRGVANAVERSFSEEYNGKILRSNSNVGSMGSFRRNTGYGGTNRSYGNGVGQMKNRREEFVLDRNRSARYSPNHVDSGLLRFYLTPMRSSRRNGGSVKSKQGNPYPFTRTLI